MNQIREIFLGILYPRRCPICHEIVRERGALICASGKKEVRPIGEPACKKCGKPIGSPAQEYCRDFRVGM